MTDNIVTLRLIASAEGVVTGVKLASGEVSKLGPAGQQAGTQASAGINTIGVAAERSHKKIGLLSGTLGQLKGVLAGYAGLMGVKELGRSADVYSDIVGKLKQVTEGERELAQAKAATFRISQETYQSLDATTTLYARSAAALAQYGVGQGKIAELTETVNRGLLISRATAQESASAILQLSQAMGAGALRGEEFNAVNEAAPRLMQLLADSLGRPRGELKKLAEDGQLTIDVLLKAFTGPNAAKLAAEAAEVPLTIGRAWQTAKNELLRYYGESDQLVGASVLVATGIATVADNVDALALGVTVLAAALAGRLVAATVAYVRTQATQILQARVQAQSELAAARAAETHAAARVALGRAGMLASGQLAAAEATLANAQARTAAATQAASLALTAKAGAMRVLNGVMAAFGGPVGVFVTGLALVVSWLVKSRNESRQLTEELNSGLKESLKALQAFNKSPSMGASSDLAEVGKQIADINRKLGELREKQQALKGLDRIPNIGAWLGYKLAIGDTNEQLKAHEGALRAMGPAYSQAVANTAALLQEMIGVKDVSPNTRAELAILANAIAEGKDVSAYAANTLARLAKEEGNAGAAAWLLKNGMDGAKQSIADVATLTEAAAGRLVNLRVQLAGLKGGTEAAIRQRYGEEIIAKGGPQKISQEGMAQIGRSMLEEIRLSKEVEAAQKAQAEARKGNAAAMRDSAKAADQAKESQARYVAQAALAAAELRGPLALAQAQSKQKTDELDAALAKHNITRAAHKALVEAEAAALAKREAEIAKQVAAPQALLDAMTGELQTLRMIGPEREIERRRLQAVAEMQRELADAREAAGNAAARETEAVRLGYSSWRDYEAAMLAAASANAVLSVRIEEQAALAEDWARVWTDAAADVADALTNFATSGLRDFKGLAKDLKNIARQLVGDLIRTFLQQKIVIPIQAQLTQVFSSGLGQTGGFLDVLRTGFDGLLSGITKIFSRGGSAAQAMQTATEAGWQMAKAAGVAVVPASGAGGMLLPGGQLLGGGSAFSGLAGMLGPLLGVGMGASMGGDTLGKLGGGLAGGALAMSLLGAGGGLAGLSAGMAAGGLFGGVSGMLGAMGPVGWAALAAFAVNKISGGKLFGTSYKTESASQQWSISDAGATGSQSVTEVKQQSFFRGRKWRTTTSALDAEAMAAVNDLFETLEQTVKTAAQQLGIDVPDIVGGSFKREFDKNGNLTREFGTIAGRVYNEAQDAFASRLVGENLLAVAKAAGSAAELEQLANAYRTTGEELQAFATLALAVQEDLRSANGIWQQVDGDGVMTRIVGYVDGLAKAGESLADAYTRIQQTITQYGDLIGGVRQQIATRGLNQYQKAQLEVELAYRQQVKQANELAKALGLSGARAEDLAAIEELRALNMADLATQYAAQQRAQNQQWLADLGLSDLSPLRDDQKLANGMDLLRKAVGAGDAQRAQKLAEQVLGLGRNLYASGADYNALYEQVTALIGDLDAASMEELQGLTNEQLANLADLVSGLPEQIAQELAALLVTPPPVATEPPTPPAPTPAPPPPSSGGGGGDGTDSCVTVFMRMSDGTLAGELQAGDVHPCLDPAEGPTEQPARWVGAAVMRPCVRLVTDSGAALVCSATTPFTHVDAPADLPEYSSLAPDMLGREVVVLRRGIRFVEPVVNVHDAGMQWVVPADFGGRSFPAGESAEAGFIYSHNMQKAPSLGNDALLMSMASSLASIAETNSAMAASETTGSLLALSESTRTGR